MKFESHWRKDRKRKNKWKDGLGFAILEEDMNERMVWQLAAADLAFVTMIAGSPN